MGAELKFEDVPYALRSTAGDWYEGGDSAMYRFWMGKPCDPEKLSREVAECVKINSDPAHEAKLEALRAFAAREAGKAKSLRKLAAAAAACLDAGVEAWEVRRAVEKAASSAPSGPKP